MVALTRPDDDVHATTLRATVERGALVEHARPPLDAGGMLGRYQLVDRLGAGAMGVVWAARDPRLDRMVAIKVVHPRLARAPEASKRLLREARAMAKVSHRAVVTVHDAGEVDGQLYVAMELVEGTTLGALLRGRTTDELANWRRWLAHMVEAGRGLAAAHREGVLHRDFKPDNVLVDRDGRVCVADFGLATIGAGGEPDARSPRDSMPLDLTRTGVVLGTPVYMSPQQLRGEPVDERADQFAFCVAAWEALYGKRPFETSYSGLAGIADLANTIESSGITLPENATHVPARVREVLALGLSAEPAARWPNMDALVDALEMAAESKRRRRARRARTLRTAATVIGCVALAIAGGFGAAQLTTKSSQAYAASSTMLPRRLFDVASRTRMAISRDGKLLVLAGSRLEVRELDGTGYWSAPLPGGTEVSAVEIDNDTVHVGHRSDHRVWSWHFRTDEAATLERAIQAGDWLGSTREGDIVLHQGADRSLHIVAGGRDVTSWFVARDTEVLSISPDRTRIAYVDGSRTLGQLVVRDLATGTQITSDAGLDVSALAWRDDATLVYAVGADHASLFTATVAADKIQRPVRVAGVEAGWIGTLAVTPSRILYVEMGVSTRTRMLERRLMATADFDSASVAAPIAWISDSSYLAWNRSSKRVDRHRGATVEPTPVVLDSQPANATLAGDVLIIAARSNEGRVTTAFSLTTGERLWTHDDHRTHAVRCAGDRTAPCFAIRLGNGPDHVLPIDPLTGKVGSQMIFEGDRLEDVAVAPGGTKLAISSLSHSSVVQLDLSTATSVLARLDMNSTRSVAFDADGSLVVTGTRRANHYQAGHLGLDGVYTPMAQTDNDIMSMIRPSPDGTHVLLLARSYSPAVYELR